MEVVKRHPGGTAEYEIEIGKVEVPDLWHFLALLDRMNPPRGTSKKWWKNYARETRECWELAHDLKKHIEGRTPTDGSVYAANEE